MSLNISEQELIEIVKQAFNDGKKSANARFPNNISNGSEYILYHCESDLIKKLIKNKQVCQK